MNQYIFAYKRLGHNRYNDTFKILKFYFKEYLIDEFNMIATNFIVDRFNRTQACIKIRSNSMKR